MKILIAEDDLVSRTVLERTLSGWGYDVVIAGDGETAWHILQQDDAPKLAILDWMMPGLDGVEVCRRVRVRANSEPTYLILLTTRHQKMDIVVGLESGANDFVAKPFDRQELRARIRVGERMTVLQSELTERILELEVALAQVKQLQGLLPICSYCKSVRDDQNYWHRVEMYLTKTSNVRLTHGICPTCYDKFVESEFKMSGADDEQKK